MRIACIADIHGNLPALETVLRDIRRRGCDRVLCLGDIIGKGPAVAEAIAMVQRESDAVIQGNWDDMVSRNVISNPWWHDRLTPEDEAWLRQLPQTHCFTLGHRKILLFHGRPLLPIFFPESEPEVKQSVLDSFREEAPDWVGYADIHRPWCQQIGKQVLFNTGSVGNSLGNMPFATYVLLEDCTGEPSLSTIRLPYPREEALRLAREADLAQYDAYEKEVLYGRYGRK